MSAIYCSFNSNMLIWILVPEIFFQFSTKLGTIVFKICICIKPKLFIVYKLERLSLNNLNYSDDVPITKRIIKGGIVKMNISLLN